METLEKPPLMKFNPASGESLWRKLIALAYPGIIVGTSLVLAGVIFLTGPEQQSLVGSNAALYKLLAGGALISILGIFFAQHVIIRASAAEWKLRFSRDLEEFAEMKKALSENIGIEENYSESI